MKKSLLTLTFAAAALAMTAAPEKVWQSTVTGAFENAPVFNATVAVDAAGNVIAAGPFDQDFTLAGSTLEAIGTSAYLAKYDVTGNALWAVAFSGSATVTAIDTDADGNIYVAGSFADEVEFGTTSGDAVVENGMSVDDAPTVEQNAAFIAKYSANGVLTQLNTIVPEFNEALAPLVGDWAADPMYLYGDGDVAFNITDLKTDGDNVYIAAVYTGVNEIGELTLDAGYVNYFGFMYADTKRAAVLSFSKDLTNAKLVSSIGSIASPGDMVFDMDAVWNAKFDVNGEKMLVAYTGAGTLQLDEDMTLFAEYDGQDVAGMFIYSLYVDGVRASSICTPVGCPTSTADNFVSDVQIVGENAYAAGRVYDYIWEGEEKTYTQSNFVCVFPDCEFAEATLTKQQAVDGELTYKSYAAAAEANGNVYVTTLAYYNEGVEGHANGEFKGVGKTYLFNGTNVAVAPFTALSVASQANYLASGNVENDNMVVTLFNENTSAVSEIEVADEAAAEYFNLQGVRVANPQNGLYIMRKGNEVSKQVIR